MEYTKAFIDRLVSRYMTHQATNEELEIFFHLLEEGKLDEALSESMENEVTALLQEGIEQKRLRTRSWRTIGIAASLTIFFICGLFTVRHYDSIIAWVAPTRYVQVRTARSEIKDITLSDGSTVRLNTGSVLEYPDNFSDTIRSVTLLEGEAFFIISHDASKPFVVWADGVRTKVLGTEFNIRSYRSFETIKVTVASGKVTVKDLGSKEEHHDTILEASDQLNIDKRTGQQKKTKVNVSETLGWREGKLFFHNERFADVASILSNKFDVQILFADPSIRDYRFSAAFEATDSLPAIVGALSLANNLTYSIQNKKITLSKIDNQK